MSESTRESVPEAMDADERPLAPGVARSVVAGVVGLNLLVTRHLLRMVTWPNDLPFHHSMVDWAAGRIRDGELPSGGWYPRLSGGLAQFQSYQSLPHTLTAALGVVIGPEEAVHLTLWLLVGTWPVSVYLGARALGLDPGAAVVGAAVAPLARSATGYGFEAFSYLWVGNGLWSQAWGMWMAPLALGWSARAVREGGRYGRAVAAVALTVAFHLPTAWFVLVALGLWVVVRPSQWRVRGARALGLGALSALASAWVVVPFLVDRWATNASSFDAGHFSDSFGWRRVLGWTLAGDVIDHGRIPTLTVAAGVGLVLVVRRWRLARDGDREVVAFAALALALFVGRDPLGPLIALIPGSSQVFLHRYLAPLQLAFALFAGLAAQAAWGRIRRRPWPVRLRVPAAAMVVLVVAAGPVRATARLLAEDADWVARQEQADAEAGSDGAELLAIAEARGGGRIFAGRLHGSVMPLDVGEVRAPIWLSHYPVDSMGFSLRVSSLAADLETYLDEQSVADLDAFGIRYLVLGRGQQPPQGAWFLAARGDLQLWEVPGEGLLHTARLVGPPLEVGRDELAEVLLPVMRAQGGSPTGVRLLHLEGRSPLVEVPPVDPSAARAAPGRVLASETDLDRGRMSATVDMVEAGVLVVKANWNPRWRARVDGEAVPVVAVAPTWLAIPVSEGRHDLTLEREPWVGTVPLMALGGLAVAAAMAWSRPSWRSRRRSGRGSPVVAVAMALVAGCGSPHVLPDPGPVAVAEDSVWRQIEVRRSEAVTTLGRTLAPDRRTLLAVAPPNCSSCSAALPDLAAAARTRGFSLLVLIRSTPEGNGVEVSSSALALGLSVWEIDDISPVPGLSPSSSGLVVIEPNGEVRGSWTEMDSASVTAAATAAGP